MFRPGSTLIKKDDSTLFLNVRLPVLRAKCNPCSMLTQSINRAATPAEEDAEQRAKRVPPHLYFPISAVLHYLGPAFAVLLFARMDVLGVAWLRIARAPAVFAVWKRPWRSFRELSGNDRRTVWALGVILASMNVCFYLAISRLPLGTVGAIVQGNVCHSAFPPPGDRMCDRNSRPTADTLSFRIDRDWFRDRRGRAKTGQ